MMQRLPPFSRGQLRLLLAGVGLFLVSTKTIFSAEPVICSGEINLREVSGAVMVGDRLLIEADDPEDKNDDVKKLHVVALLMNPVERLQKRTVQVDDKEYALQDLLQKQKLSDIEDATVAPDGTVYLITSHSLNSGSEQKDSREHLIRFRVGADGNIGSPEIIAKRLVKALPDVLKDSTSRRPGSKDAKGEYDPGFNIEGLAWGGDNTLLIGVRSPLVEKKAVILRLKNVAATFGGSKPEVLVEAALDLGGRNGIRGMAADPELKGYWIVGGLSPDPDDPPPGEKPALENKWAIWFWDGKEKLEKRFEKGQLGEVDLQNPEAVCVLRDNDQKRVGLLLISDDGGGNKSHYALLSFDSLQR